MKKNKVLILSLLVLPLLAACSQSVFVPSFPYPGDPIHGDAGEGGNGGGEGGDVDVSEANMTVNFYLDFSHSEIANKEYEGLTDKNAKDCEPIYTMRWYMLKPLGKCPEQAVLTDAKAADPLYGHFIGYSEYPSAMDESLLWNFETDYKQANVLNLYGIWVSQQEVTR